MCRSPPDLTLVHSGTNVTVSGGGRVKKDRKNGAQGQNVTICEEWCMRQTGNMLQFEIKCHNLGKKDGQNVTVTSRPSLRRGGRKIPVSSVRSLSITCTVDAVKNRIL